jgi:hypothetical protein
MREQDMKVRRVVAGNDPSGRSVFLSDDVAPNSHDFEFLPGQAHARIWLASGDATTAAPDEEPTANTGQMLPDPGGASFLVVQYAPDSVVTDPRFDGPKARAEFATYAPDLAETMDRAGQDCSTSSQERPSDWYYDMTRRPRRNPHCASIEQKPDSNYASSVWSPAVSLVGRMSTARNIASWTLGCASTLARPYWHDPTTRCSAALRPHLRSVICSRWLAESCAEPCCPAFERHRLQVVSVKLRIT